MDIFISVILFIWMTINIVILSIILYKMVKIGKEDVNNK